MWINIIQIFITPFYYFEGKGRNFRFPEKWKYGKRKQHNIPQTLSRLTQTGTGYTVSVSTRFSIQQGYF